MRRPSEIMVAASRERDSMSQMILLSGIGETLEEGIASIAELIPIGLSAIEKGDRDGYLQFEKCLKPMVWLHTDDSYVSYMATFSGTEAERLADICNYLGIQL